MAGHFMVNKKAGLSFFLLFKSLIPLTLNCLGCKSNGKIRTLEIVACFYASRAWILGSCDYL